MSEVPHHVSCSNASSFFSQLHNAVHLLSINKAPFLFCEVSLFVMAFVTAALADLIVSVGILSDIGPRGSGNPELIIFRLPDDFIVM